MPCDCRVPGRSRCRLVVVVRVLLLGLAVVVFAHVLLLGFGFWCSVSHSWKGRLWGSRVLVKYLVGARR